MVWSGFRRCLAVASLSITTFGCGGGETTGSNDPTQLVIKSGENQSGSVGLALTGKVVVEARNAKGGVAGVTIVASVEQPGGGSVSPSSVATAADGTAQFTWTLGPKVGAQALRFTTTGATPVNASVNATATVGTAAGIVALSETFQLIVVGHAAASLPSVRVNDAFGNAVAGATVQFEALNAGSVLSGTTQTTNAAGTATLGGWTIGNEALSYTIRASIDAGTVAIFEARGIPASFTVVAGAGQTANAGTAVAVPPAVKAARDDGSALANVTVNFAVTGGGGVALGTTATTGVDGIARPIQWVLGTVPGANRLEASTAGRSTLNFDATGVAAVAASAVATGGTALSGFFGNYLPDVPEVTVQDASGNPVAAISVNFQVADGGGQLTGVATQTDFLGRARPTSWRLGTAGTQRVTAVAGSLAPVSFTATGSTPPPSTFKIEIRYRANFTATQKAAFDAAVARWKQLILAGGDPYLIFEFVNGCSDIRGETVDGVVIFADLLPSDGVNGVLAAATWCIVRDIGFLPAQSIMFFDPADLTALESAGQLNVTIQHEMGHALGFGTIWDLDAGVLGVNAFLSGYPGSDPTFNGPAARAAFYGALAPPGIFSGIAVPVEGGFGLGTRYSHWRESTFRNELMTGILDNGANPLSAITVQQFHDLGYIVNDAPAEPYSFAAAIQGGLAPQFRLIEADPPIGPRVVINRQGRAVTWIPRPFR